MKTKQLRRILITVGSLCLVALDIFGNTTANWTNNSGGNAWETAGNWDVNAVPNNNSFNVALSIAAPCNLSSGYQINSLNLSTGSANLNLVPGAVLAFTSNVTNNGAITVNTTAAGANTFLRFDASGALGGTGSVLLNGVAFNNGDIYANGGSLTVTQGASHTIHGRGNINIRDNNCVFVNNGTVDADNASGNALSVYLSNSTSNQNNKTMEATNGGFLVLQQGFLDQTGGGSILADGANSLVQLGGSANPTVKGGILNTTNNGLINGVDTYLDSVTNNGTLDVPGGRTIAVLGTGLTNNSVLTVNPTANGANTYLRFDASGALDGTGSVLLNGVAFNNGDIYANGGSLTVTQGASHTIHGRGNINIRDNNCLFVNNGTVNADSTGNALVVYFSYAVGNQNNKTMEATNGGVLAISQGTFDQGANGVVLADGANSVAQIGNSAQTNIAGGELNTANGGIIEGLQAVLGNGVTNSGAYEVPSNDYTIFNGSTFTNNGTMTLDAFSSTFGFSAATSIAGAGAMVLTNGATMNINGQSVTNGVNHTIQGNGNIAMSGGSLTNNGTIAPGTSPGELDYSGTLILGSTSNLSFEIGGNGQGTTYDWLKKTDSATQTLAGNLTVKLIDGFVPANSDVFTIITTQQILAGSFANVPNGGRLETEGGEGSFQVTYNVFNNPIASSNVVLSDFQSSSRCDSNPPTITLLTPNIEQPIRPLKKKVNHRTGAYVYFTATAQDPEDGTLRVTFNPPSGSFFPLGQTLVTMTATDRCGNTAQATFTITVANTKKKKP